MKANPVLWIVCALPASAVIAGLSTLGIALREADRPLPSAYHWEGSSLDGDFERLRAAALQGVGAELRLQDRECQVVVSRAPADAASLSLLLTNSSDADLDRAVRLVRQSAGHYRSRCDALPAGRWRISLDDGATWALRAEVEGSLERQELRARNPDGPPA